MACNCKEILTAKMLSNVQKNLPESQNHEVSLMGYSTCINKETLTLSTRGSMLMEIRHKAINKRTGNSVDKKIKEALFFTYCPFCGAPYKDEVGVKNEK